VLSGWLLGINSIGEIKRRYILDKLQNNATIVVMALIIPDTTDGWQTTAGEARVFHFFKTQLLPHTEYIVWYAATVTRKRSQSRREADFVLYSPHTGIIVFEVKDWSLASINTYSDGTFYIKGHPSPFENPYQSARRYTYNLKDSLQRYPQLCHQSGKYAGKFLFPINPAVIFTNIKRAQWEASAYAPSIPSQSVLYADDIKEMKTSDTPSPLRIRSMLQELVQTRFDFQALTHEQFSIMKHLLRPDAHLPSEKPRMKIPKESARRRWYINMRSLDILQEREAYTLGGGHRLIQGMAGSGKTLVVLFRVRILMNNPEWKNRRILLVCFNITLVRYLRQMLQQMQVDTDRPNLTITNFNQLCYSLHRGEDELPVNPDALARMTIRGINSNSIDTPAFDAILVDEGQDFSPAMLGALQGLLNPRTNHFVVTFDPDQDLYNRCMLWPTSSGTVTKRPVHVLPMSYRCTSEIQAVAHAVMPPSDTQEAKRENEPVPAIMTPEALNHHGPYPAVVQCADNKTVYTTVKKTIIDALRAGIAPSGIGIIYFRRSDYGGLCGRIAEQLRADSISAFNIAESPEAKMNFDIDSNSVTVSTIYSIKGFEFPLVIILGTDSLHQSDGKWSEEDAWRRLYVGMTRAQEHVVIPYISANMYINTLIETISVLRNKKQFVPQT